MLLKEMYQAMYGKIDTRIGRAFAPITEVDDEQMIKYKAKDGESKEMKASSAKTMPMDHPAKVEYDKLAGGDDGGAKKGVNIFDKPAEEPEGEPEGDSRSKKDFGKLTSIEDITDDEAKELSKNLSSLTAKSIFQDAEEYGAFDSSKALKDADVLNQIATEIFDEYRFPPIGDKPAIEFEKLTKQLSPEIKKALSLGQIFGKTHQDADKFYSSLNLDKLAGVSPKSGAKDVPEPDSNVKEPREKAGEPHVQKVSDKFYADIVSGDVTDEDDLFSAASDYVIQNWKALTGEVWDPGYEGHFPNEVQDFLDTVVGDDGDWTGFQDAFNLSAEGFSDQAEWDDEAEETVPGSFTGDESDENFPGMEGPKESIVPKGSFKKIQEQWVKDNLKVI